MRYVGYRYVNACGVRVALPSGIAGIHGWMDGWMGVENTWQLQRSLALEAGQRTGL